MTDDLLSQLVTQPSRPWVVEACGYPAEGWNLIATTDTYPRAVQIADGIAKAPGCTATRVQDSRVKLCA